MQRPLGAQISHMLKDRGVDVIFGIPGVHNIEMYRGIEEAGITHVLARHEQGAGFMADGYARATGKPGVAYVITGPGVCNIMTPMGQAYSDSVPMLVLSSCLDETAARRGQLHQMKDQAGAAGCVCDWSEEARSAQAAYHLIDRALGEFLTLRKRPKHIQVPIALLGTPCPAPEATFAQGADARPAAAADVRLVADQLRAARRPLLVFGGGAAGARDAARDVMVRSGAAGFMTYAGRGLIDGLDMSFGAYLARPDSAKIFASADLVVFVGTDVSEIDLWRSHPGHACPAISVNIEPESVNAEARVTRHIRADAGAFLQAVAAELGDADASSDWAAAEVAAARAKWRAEVEADRPGIVPVLDALRAAMPEDATVFSDMTQFAYSAKEVWPLTRPSSWHHPFGFGTLGYALPAAIGGKVGLGDAPVVCIAGDYGFQYTLQELGVAVELGLSLPIILWDNGKLKEIEDAMVNSQIAPNAVVARNPDFCALAEAYGAASAKPATLDALQDDLRKALDRSGPTLIHVEAGIG